ncbi:MAG: GNAT family N-acetyltransferase [Oscillospiraceae bacterium]|nr:GNAT family N-acetyltransferase [Oscillospiraceae bacterium]
MQKVRLRRAVHLRDWCRIWRLYLQAFPACERKPFAMILRMCRQGYADVWVIEQPRRFSGLAITMKADDLVLLDYFAVSPKVRGGGIGSMALRTLQRMYEGKRFFLEIESTFADAEDLPERQRRKRFYLRNGMQELNVHADLFGVEMELLGYECSLTFAEYHQLYLTRVGSLAEGKVREIEQNER